MCLFTWFCSSEVRLPLAPIKETKKKIVEDSWIKFYNFFMQAIASNKKANHDYFIFHKFDAGIVLSGSEVKSLRVNSASIKESYVKDKNGELWLTNCHIKKYLLQ